MLSEKKSKITKKKEFIQHDCWTGFYHDPIEIKFVKKDRKNIKKIKIKKIRR